MNPTAQRAIGTVVVLVILRLIQTIFFKGVFVPWVIVLPLGLILAIGTTEIVYRIRHRKDDPANLLGLSPNVICAACGHDNPANSKSCIKCGVKFASYAPLP